MVYPYIHYLTGASHVVLVVNNLPSNAGDAGDTGLIPRLGRSPGGEHGNPLQYSCLKNPMDRGAWWATNPWGYKQLDMTEHACNNNNKKTITKTLNKNTDEPSGIIFIHILWPLYIMYAWPLYIIFPRRRWNLIIEMKESPIATWFSTLF